MGGFFLDFFACQPFEIETYVVQGGGDLLVKTQALYFQRENAGGGTSALVEAVAMDAWER